MSTTPSAERLSRAASLARPGVGRRAMSPLALYVAAGCALGAVLGFIAVSQSKSAIVLIVALALILYVWLTTVHPTAAVGMLLASLTLIPVYVVPMDRTFAPEPSAVAATAVAIGLTTVRGRVRFTTLDWAFLTLCLTMLLAAMLGPHSLYATAAELFLWVPAYIAGRAICKRRRGSTTLAGAAALAGVVALPFIFYETVSGQNVFLKLAWPGTELTRLWDHASYRPGGLLRSQGAFGHPLSMGFVIGACAVFALALAVRARSRWKRTAWGLSAAALAVGQYTAHERSGWIVLIGGVVVYALTSVSPRTLRLRRVLTVVLALIPLAVGAVLATQSSNHAAGVARAGSTADRVDLWRHAFEPGAFALEGLPETIGFNHFANAVTPGLTSIDSGFLQVGDVFGLLSFIALFVVVAMVIKSAATTRQTWNAVLPAVALSGFAALTVIGFQTQVPTFIWLVVGATSGVELSMRRDRVASARRVPSPRAAASPAVVPPRSLKAT